MVKKYDARNPNRASSPAVQRVLKKDCRTCDNTRQVRVSRPRKGTRSSPAKQEYDIVTENCPDC